MEIDDSKILDEIQRLQKEQTFWYEIFKVTDDPDKRSNISYKNQISQARIKALRWVLECGGVVENFAHELSKEPLTEALNKHNVMESVLPTENEISAEAFEAVTPYGRQTTVNDRRNYFKKGARWAITKLSGKTAP